MNSSKRFATLVLGAGIVVLLVAIVLGEQMGDRTIGNAGEHILALPVAITPAPQPTSPPYASDWKRSQTLSAAPDPRFPDPRVPPMPLPTPIPVSTKMPSPKPTRTQNPNIPIWDQTPLPTATPSGGVPVVSPSTSAATPAPSPSSSA